MTLRLFGHCRIRILEGAQRRAMTHEEPAVGWRRVGKAVESVNDTNYYYF